MKEKTFTHWVITADQRRSRTSPDGVPAALDALAHLGDREAERTAGDEIQIVGHQPGHLVLALRALLRSGDWRVGVGFGTAELGTTVRASRGAAFIAAREALEAAHAQPAGLAVAGSPGVVSGTAYAGGVIDRLHATLVLLHSVWTRRTADGWHVVDAVDRGLSGKEIADNLGISPSAVSQRLRAAHWQAGRTGEEMLLDLAGEALA